MNPKIEIVFSVNAYRMVYTEISTIMYCTEKSGFFLTLLMVNWLVAVFLQLYLQGLRSFLCQ